MTYPGLDLFPSSTTFPAGAASVDFGGYRQVVQVSLGGLVLTATDAFGVDWIADGVEGWRGSPPSTLQVAQKSRAPGGWASSRNLSPRTLTVSGFVDAPTPTQLDAALDRLNAAASLSDRVFTVVAQDGSARSCIVARQGEVLIDPVNERVAQWSVQLLAAEPRKFGRALSDSTGLPLSSGGFSAPLVAPLKSTATVVSGIVALTNPGNATGPVVVRLDGPLIAPRVTHTESGLSWSTSLTVHTGEYLVIDMEAQTVEAQGTASRSRQNTSRGWLPFLPGANRYALSASSGSGQMTVTATPAWL